MTHKKIDERAGLCPFAILVFALNNLGGQLFQAMGFG
ncbi:MAG: hypothetical protein QOG91_232, partial [Candidatus Parcubacteria bacterium]|nr:hypothetical protein [Candidatus Parcubacteria bacterium]